MLQQILDCIKWIDEGIAWTRKNKPEVFESVFIQLTELQRQLYKIAEAERDNPAIAAYGKSQTGKSYLMSNILQQNGNPFVVYYDGKPYDFIKDMNPITDNNEATGVVTRFSSYSRNPNLFFPEHPVTMRTLSIDDIIMVLCDGYYNDLIDYNKPDNIAKLGEEIYNHYISAPIIDYPILNAVDVLEMKFYVGKYINNAQDFYKSDFFDRIALIANRIPVSDYSSVFSILWDNDSNLTTLFNRFITLYQRLSYAHNLYLPIDALLHKGDNENTILSVQCLRGLKEKGNFHRTDVYLHEGNTFKVVPNIDKSELSAICAEVVFHIDKEFLESSEGYDFSMIVPDVANRISHSPIKKDILKDSDLLDFPGARSRLNEKRESLNGYDKLCQVLLRGKVAYLFNKYNESRALNILLFCHDHEQNDVTTIPSILESWVHNYVGTTPEERHHTIDMAGGISPLFHIATKFNINMEQKQNESANTRTALDGRWAARFSTTLWRECFNTDGVDWVKDWIAKGHSFQNCYLLRDFKYSGERASKLYSGFASSGEEGEMTISQEFYNTIQQSFCESEHVRIFFDDPAMAWNVAATRNNDGALYIIEKLSIVARRMLQTRNDQFSRQITESAHRAHSLLKDWYQSDDVSELLKANIRRARIVTRYMDPTCEDDNYFFGHLIHAMQMSEAEVSEEIHKLKNGSELNQGVNEIGEYEIIRSRCGMKLDKCSNDEEKWQVLVDEYGFIDKKECKEFFEKRHVDVYKLFANSFKPKVCSVIIADHIYNKWIAKLQSPSMVNELTVGTQFDPGVMLDLIKNIVEKSSSLHLDSIMSSRIAEFTNLTNPALINESLVGDILSSVISDYVCDLGFSYLSPEQIDQLHIINDQYNLSLFNFISKSRKSQYEPEELTQVFNLCTREPNALMPSIEDTYRSWTEYMVASFVSNIEVQDYDKEANDALAEILTNLNNK